MFHFKMLIRFLIRVTFVDLNFFLNVEHFDFLYSNLKSKSVIANAEMVPKFPSRYYMLLM